MLEFRPALKVEEYHRARLRTVAIVGEQHPETATIKKFGGQSSAATTRSGVGWRAWSRLAVLKRQTVASREPTAQLVASRVRGGGADTEESLVLAVAGPDLPIVESEPADVRNLKRSRLPSRLTRTIEPHRAHSRSCEYRAPLTAFDADHYGRAAEAEPFLRRPWRCDEAVTGTLCVPPGEFR